MSSSEARQKFLPLSSTLPLVVSAGTSMLIQFTMSIYTLNEHSMSIGRNSARELDCILNRFEKTNVGIELITKGWNK